MATRRDRRRALRQAAKHEGEGFVATTVALRAGQLLWYVGTYPLRLLVRGLDAL